MYKHLNGFEFKSAIITAFYINLILMGMIYETARTCPSFLPFHVLSTLSFICFCFASVMVLFYTIDIIGMICLNGLAVIRVLLHPYSLLSR